MWDIEERVKVASAGQQGPSACPPDRLFVPAALRSEVCHIPLSELVILAFREPGSSYNGSGAPVCQSLPYLQPTLPATRKVNAIKIFQLKKKELIIIKM